MMVVSLVMIISTSSGHLISRGRPTSGNRIDSRTGPDSGGCLVGGDPPNKYWSSQQ